MPTSLNLASPEHFGGRCELCDFKRCFSEFVSLWIKCFFSFLFYSASWSYIEDSEEFSEQKDDSLPSNRLASVMTSDASAAAAALAACSDAQRGMDDMAR